jgi:hypothetical protein
MAVMIAGATRVAARRVGSQERNFQFRFDNARVRF